LPQHAGLATLILNILLYLPWGAVLAARTGSVRSGLLGGFLLSVMIETAQIWIPGRHTSLMDVGANSLGAMIGAFLTVRRDLWFAPVGKSARIFALAWLGIAGMALASVGPLLTPGFPNTTLYSSWTPHIGSLERYDGAVLAARVGEVPLPEGGPIPETLQARLRSDLRFPALVQLTFIAGSAPVALAPVLRIQGPGAYEGLLVGVDGEDIVVRRRFIADNLRLARPDLRLRGALSEAVPGDTIRLWLEREDSGVEVLTVNGESGRFGISPARGWSLFRYNSAWSNGWLVILDFAWLTLLVLPFGWWARSIPILVVGGSLLAFTLLVWPRLAGTFPGTFLQVVALLAIAAIGFLLRTICERKSGGVSQSERWSTSGSVGL